MKTNDELYEILTRIERAIFATIPFRRLPLDMQRRAAELEGNPARNIEGGARREELAIREFEKMAGMDIVKRKNAKWPRVLLPKLEARSDGSTVTTPLLPVVPLSGLINRLAARGVFAILPGELTPSDNARESVKRAGLVITTPRKLGLANDCEVQVVHAAGFNLEEAHEVTADDEKWEKEMERKPAPVHTPKPKKERPSVWSGIVVEPETFEESECAAGVGRIPSRDEEEEPEEDLSDTTDIVERAAAVREKIEQELDDDLIEDDDDWGPDEVDTHNPEKEAFEREAEEAYQKDQKLLASGDYFLKNGVVTKKAGR
jgi:hypothetical protein